MHGLNFYTKFQIPQMIILLTLAPFLIDYVWFICHWTSHGLSQKNGDDGTCTSMVGGSQRWEGQRGSSSCARGEQGAGRGHSFSCRTKHTQRHCHTRGNNGCPACVWLISSDILGVRAVSAGGCGGPHNGRRYERRRLHWTFLALVLSFFLLLLRNWTVVLLTKCKELHALVGVKLEWKSVNQLTATWHS